MKFGRWKMEDDRCKMEDKETTKVLRQCGLGEYIHKQLAKLPATECFRPLPGALEPLLLIVVVDAIIINIITVILMLSLAIIITAITIIIVTHNISIITITIMTNLINAIAP